MNKVDLENFRRQIKPVAEALMDSVANTPDGSVPSEVIANTMLAYRHLEDASMRIGKAMQAIDGGISVYDMTQTPKSVSA
jgi:hypothetical protein